MIESFLKDLNIPKVLEEQKVSCQGKITWMCIAFEKFSKQQITWEWWDSHEILEKFLIID